MSTARQVYVSTACVRGLHESLEALLLDYLESGIPSVELGFCPPFRQHDLSGFLRGCGAEFVVHNYFPAPKEPFVINLASSADDIYERSLRLAERAIDLCASIGAAFYSVHSGFRADFAPSALGATLEGATVYDYEVSYSRFVNALRKLARRAQGVGVGLLVEPNVVERRNLVKGRNDLLLMATSDELLRLVADVAEPGFGVLLDTGHLNVTAATLEFDRDDFVKEVAPHIKAFHLHDNDGMTDHHWPAKPASWATALVTQSQFAGVPLIVESNFRSVKEASTYIKDQFLVAEKSNDG